MLLNKLNNEVGFNFEFFRNPSGDINRSLPNIRSVVPQVGCSAESFERVGKRTRSKENTVRVTRACNKHNDSSIRKTFDDGILIVPNETVNSSTPTTKTTMTNGNSIILSKRPKAIANIDKIKRKPTIILDEIPTPRVILPKTILFDIDSGNIENSRERDKFSESSIIDTATSSSLFVEETAVNTRSADNCRLCIDPLDVF